MSTPDSAVRRFLTARSPLHGGMRLCDLLPILPIGVVLLILWPHSDGWAAVVWLALSGVSMYLTSRFIRSTDERGGIHPEQR